MTQDKPGWVAAALMHSRILLVSCLASVAATQEAAVLDANDARASVADVAEVLDAARRQAIEPLLAEIQRRLAAAKAGRVSPEQIVSLAELEEQYVMYLRGSMLPRFLREPPPVFAAKPSRQKKSLRFVAFGDFGTEGTSQLKVATAMRAEHRKQRFDLGITLGDNFYDYGAETPTNERWISQWENMYSPLRIDFYASLGNHDWYHPDSPAAEMLYSQRSKSWNMPAPYYTFTAGPVQFFAIDTGDGEDGWLTGKQLLWLESSLAASQAKWKIVYGHHPVFGGSREDNRAFAEQLMPVLRAGKVDAVLAGHDHVLAHLKPEDGIEFLVAGGGGSETYEMRKDNPRLLFGAATHGFLVVDVTQNDMRFRFIDENGRSIHDRRVAESRGGKQ